MKITYLIFLFVCSCTFDSTSLSTESKLTESSTNETDSVTTVEKITENLTTEILLTGNLTQSSSSSSTSFESTSSTSSVESTLSNLSSSESTAVSTSDLSSSESTGLMRCYNGIYDENEEICDDSYHNNWINAACFECDVNFLTAPVLRCQNNLDTCLAPCSNKCWGDILCMMLNGSENFESTGIYTEDINMLNGGLIYFANSFINEYADIDAKQSLIYFPPNDVVNVNNIADARYVDVLKLLPNQMMPVVGITGCKTKL